jgi:prepilin peptidase CpaA
VATLGGSGSGQLPRLVTGYGAAALSIYFLISYRTDIPIFATSIYFFLICITDTLKSKIPNLLNLSLIIFGLTYSFYANSWGGLVSHSLLGMVMGLMLLLLPYLLGGFGAGDVKSLAAVGSVVGPEAILHVFVYMALWGGALAVVHYLFNRELMGKVRDSLKALKTSAISLNAADLTPTKVETLRFPYAAAIALGYFTYIGYGSILKIL